MLKKLFFSELLLNSSRTKKIVYIALLTAFSVVTNMFFEFKFFDVQFSFTIIVSAIIGGLIGAVPAFLACMLGDFLGYVYSSWGYVYMPWVGLSTGMIAFIAGIIINGVNIKVKGEIYIKLVLVCVISFLVCTVGINSTGFYFYNRAMGFSKAVLDYVAERFGGKEVSYFAYVAYRLIFKLQLINCIVNYAVLIAVYPLIIRIMNSTVDKQASIVLKDNVLENAVNKKIILKCNHCGSVAEYDADKTPVCNYCGKIIYKAGK